VGGKKWIKYRAGKQRNRGLAGKEIAKTSVYGSKEIGGWEERDHSIQKPPFWQKPQGFSLSDRNLPKEVACIIYRNPMLEMKPGRLDQSDFEFHI
jgi:hypothetical protein